MQLDSLEWKKITNLNWQKISAYSGDIPDAWSNVTRNCNVDPTFKWFGNSFMSMSGNDSVSISSFFSWVFSFSVKQNGHSKSLPVISLLTGLVSDKQNIFLPNGLVLCKLSYYYCL